MGVTAGIFLASILLFPPARNVPRVTKLLSGIMFQGKIQNFGGNSGGIFKITFCINFPIYSRKHRNFQMFHPWFTQSFNLSVILDVKCI
jgi:hypothetical protein